jgi:hypothetical protein
MKISPCWLFAGLCHLAIAGAALGYSVGPALTLEQLTAEADLIFKGEALASEAVEDAWFKPVPAFTTTETRFRIISLIKGQVADGEVRFRHYDEKKVPFGFSYSPQFYQFEPGRTYIVCAHKTEAGARQTRIHHTMHRDLGVLRCRDSRPVTSGGLREIYWSELMALRESARPDDVIYAIQQWGAMSKTPGDEWMRGTTDFSRIEVLNAVRGLISRPEPAIAQAAIRLVGAGSP